MRQEASPRTITLLYVARDENRKEAVALLKLRQEECLTQQVLLAIVRVREEERGESKS